MGIKKLVLAAIPAVLVMATSSMTSPLAATAAGATVGQWSAAFEEPIGQYTVPTGPTDHCTPTDATGYKQCMPTAVNASVLPDGRVVYWNGLSDLENIQQNTVLEAGGVADSSYARVLDLRSGSPVFSTPTPPNGAGPEPCDLPNACGASTFPLPGNNGPDPGMTGNAHGADHDMFCSDNVQLADGRILVAGGTRWYQEPNIPGTPYGQAELQGLRLTQVFDPRTNTFSRLAPMNNGRWYPGLVMLGNGNVFVGGGVRKLIQTDGTNVRQTETFNPNVTSRDPGDGQTVAGQWTVNQGGDAAMPLFPRYHLMPDGSIYYDGSGQMWGPAGESADEALYSLHQSYEPTADPTTGSHWKVFGLGTYGARSGAFSVLLPLKAPYTSADVLTGGGTVGPPPGGYVSTNFSEVSHFDASSGWAPTFSVGPMLTQRRWFSSTVTLPNDAVAVFNGADKDEVVDPGNESAVRMAEWYTPWDGQFHALSADAHDRTYHNTAILLPDASILVGGHAPIAAGYGATSNTEHDATAGTPVATANNFRDPSFEVYRPPYLFKGPRPVIAQVQSGIAWGRPFELDTGDATTVSSVRLIRLPSLTHVVDGNMRSVELPFTAKSGRLLVSAPPNGNVAPPGNYYLFINRGKGADAVPSTAAIVHVGDTVDTSAAPLPFGNGASQPSASRVSLSGVTPATTVKGAPAAAGVASLPSRSGALDARGAAARRLTEAAQGPVLATGIAGLAVVTLLLAIGVRRRRRAG